MPAKHESPLTLTIPTSSQQPYLIDVDLRNFDLPLISSCKLHALFFSSYSPMSSQFDPPFPAQPSSPKSRYLTNAPPPLQLKSSSHRPPSMRYSRRISRDRLRASIQSFESGGPLTPLTARPPMPSKKEQHRRRLWKLKRTFGDEIPIDVINSSLLATLAEEDMLELSVLSPQTPRPTQTQTTRRPSPSLPHANSDTRQDHIKARKKGGMLPPLVTHPTPSSSVSTKTSVKVSREARCTPASPPVIVISAHGTVPLTPTFDEDEPSDSTLSIRPSLKSSGIQASAGQWPRTPFSHAFEPVGARFAQQTAKRSVRRSERRQGWSGEWNQPDIQDVIERLRNMK